MTALVDEGGMSVGKEVTTFDKGVRFFIVTTIVSVIGQIFYYTDAYVLFQVITIPLVILVLLYTTFSMEVHDVFTVLFLVVSTRYITGLADRELKEIVLIPIFLSTLLFRKGQFGRRRFPIFFVLYALMGVWVFFHGFDVPDYTSLKPDQVTGFQGRWWVACSLVSFIVGYYFSGGVDLKRFLRTMFYFYFITLMLSSAMFVFGVDEMPLFNLYSWMKLEGVDRFGILSVSGGMCVLLLLVNRDFIGSSILRFALIALGFWAVAAGGGRATLLGLLFSIGVYFYHVRKKKGFMIVASLAVAVFVLAFSALDLKSILPEKYRRVTDFGDPASVLPALSSGGTNDSYEPFESDAAGSSAWRLLIWARALEAIPKHPVFGNGILTEVGGGFGSKTNSITDEFILLSGNLHNTYLSLAYVWGIPAMFFFVSLVFGAIKRSLVLAEAPGDHFYKFIFLYFSGQLVEAFMTDIHLLYPFMMLLGVSYAHFPLVVGRPSQSSQVEGRA